MALNQVHDKFKLFVGTVAPDGSVGVLGDQIAAFAREAKVAPKSIGVEYLENARKVVLSLGYRDDESPYAIKISTASIGKLGALAPDDVARLESAMAQAVQGVTGIICHELFVTENGDCRMVMMSRA